MVQVCVPANAFNPDVLDALFVNAPTGCVQRIMVWNAELTVAAVDGDPHPQFVGLDKWKDLLVGERLDVADDEELFLVFHELRDIFAEKGEGWVGHHDVRLFEQLDTLGAAEVAASREAFAGVGVLLQEERDVFDAGRSVPIDILHFLYLDCNCFGLLALIIALLVLFERKLCAGDWGTVVAGADKLFQSQLVEVGGKVLEEVALEGVVAIAVDNLAAEGVGVEFEVGLDLFLDVNVLSVELVLLGFPRCGQILIHRLAFHEAIGFLGF